MLQDSNNVFIIERAGLDKKVVHLKGADPFVFGRGGEETLHLAKNAIPFEKVPSIKSYAECAS